jgi:hypothetical protein
MKRLTDCAPMVRVTALALGVVALENLAGLGPLQNLTGLWGRAHPSQHRMPIKASLMGRLTPRFVIPLEQPIKLGNFSAEGSSDLLGPVNLVEANTLHTAVDGKSIFVTDGIGVLTAAKGEALFLNYRGPITNAEATTADFAVTVCGGRGRFQGASGSGVLHCALQPDQKTFTRVFDGTVAVPK